MHILSILASPPKYFAWELWDVFNTNVDSAVHTLSKIDLYSEKFNPVFTQELAYGDDIMKYQNMLKNADMLVFFYPVWNLGLPAILQGFLNKIFQEGFAYKHDKNYTRGLLKNKQALIISHSRQPNWQLKFIYGNSLEMFWKRSVLASAGIRKAKYKNFDLIGAKNSAEREILGIEELKMLAESI